MSDHAAHPLTLCAVFAHPDDEAFGVSGTLAKYAAQDVRTALICVTRGEAGMSNSLAASPEALAAVRTAETRCAAEAMGLTDLVLLDFADGGAEHWDRGLLARQIREALRRIRPAVVITFDPGGVTRHPDHLAVHAAVRSLVLGSEVPGVRRLYYQVVTCPEQTSPEGPSLACVAPEAVDVAVDVRHFEASKRAALRCHRSQAADTAQLLELPEGSLAEECYVLAWPADGGRPAPGAGDLLAGL